MMKKLILAVLIIIYLTVLTGCHTIHGVGQDIESAGESIQKATDKK
jgi:predicted small secreted protein